MQTKTEYETIRGLSGDALIDYLNEKNKLESSKQIDLVTAIVIHCPDNEMGKLNKQISKMVSLFDELGQSEEISSEDGTDFLIKLTNAFALKKELTALTYANICNPHQQLLAIELDCANEFNKLALTVIAGNEVNIVKTLAKKTPPMERSKVALHIERLFPKSVLATKVRAAFETAREQERTQVRLSEEPVSEPNTNVAEPSTLRNRNALFTQSSTSENTSPERFKLLPDHLNDDEKRSCCETFCTVF